MGYLFEKKSRFRFVLYGFGMLLIFASTALFSQGFFLFKDLYRSNNYMLILMFLPFVCGMFVLFFTVKYLIKIPFKRLITTRNRIDFKRFFVGFFLSSFLILSIYTVYIIAQPKNFIWHFQPLRFLGLFFITVVFVPIQAMFEEVFFRGYCAQMIFTMVRSRVVVLIFSALFFALMHLSNPEINALGYALILIYFLWGAFFSLVIFLDGAMELVIGMHTAHNLCLALFISYKSSILQTDSLFVSKVPLPSFWWQMIIFFAVSIPVFFFLSKRYQWNCSFKSIY